MPQERDKKQNIVVNISFGYLYEKDSEVVDYTKVVTKIKNFIKKQKFKLLEDAVIQTKKELLNSFRIKDIKIEIKKPDILTNCIVSCEI